MSKKFLFKLLILCYCFSSIHAGAENWPTHRHDNARSGVTSEAPKMPLEQKWMYQSPHPPQSAWPGPARRDGWHKVDNLKPRVIFDWAFHVVAANGAVFFGSSADDKLYCLDGNTGEERWAYYADAPIRLAPSIDSGKVYFGSDDGNVYCLDEESGELIWKYKPSEEDYRVIGHGKMMSLWPIRSGVLIDQGLVYFSAGLFPSEQVYFCALNATTGDVVWKKTVDNIPPQGYILASTALLFVPTGGGTPAVLDKSTGDYQYSLGGSGGAFAVLTEDMLIYGPGKTGELDAFSSSSNSPVAQFNGNHIVLTRERSFLHTDTEMSALDRIRFAELTDERIRRSKRVQELTNQLKELAKEVSSEQGQKISKEIEKEKIRLAQILNEIRGCILWKKECKFPYSLILAGNTLFAGGTDEVAGFDADTGEMIWHHEVEGRALDLAFAEGQLLVSTDEGLIYCFGAKEKK